MFYAHVKRLQQDERQLTQLEKCALMESLVLLSNQFKDYARQKAFLEELMAPVTNLWLSAEMHRYIFDYILFLPMNCMTFEAVALFLCNTLRITLCCSVLSDPAMFLSYIGADVTPDDPIREDPAGINRSRVRAYLWLNYSEGIADMLMCIISGKYFIQDLRTDSNRSWDYWRTILVLRLH